MLLVYMIPAAVLSFLVHLLLHEVGHMLGGLITGWRLINLQVYHYALVREGNKIKFRYLPEVNYQCIMYPRSVYTGAIIYTIGGYWTNLLLAIVGLLMMLLNIENIAVWSYYWCLFGIGITFFLINGLPNIRRVCNDRACYHLLKESRNTRECHNAQLMIAKYLNEGFTYKMIDEELICLSGDRADNDILAYQAILEYYYYLEMNNYNMVLRSLEKTTVYESYSKGLVDIIALEQLYTELVLWFEEIVTEPIGGAKYGSDIRFYILEHGVIGDVHTARVKVIYDVYECVGHGNIKEAITLLNAAIMEVKDTKCLYEGEKIFCIQQIINIKELCMRKHLCNC